jgi:hypothetical protein
VEGTWEWSSTGKQFSIYDWNPGEPDNHVIRIACNYGKSLVFIGMTLIALNTITISVKQGNLRRYA